jgi:hypothetical protein
MKSSRVNLITLIVNRLVSKKIIFETISSTLFQMTKNCPLKKNKAEHERDYRCSLKSRFSDLKGNFLMSR